MYDTLAVNTAILLGQSSLYSKLSASREPTVLYMMVHIYRLLSVSSEFLSLIILAEIMCMSQY